MTDHPSKPSTAFYGNRLLASGPLADVALAVRDAIDAGVAGPILVFDDTDGRVVDLDIRGTRAELSDRLRGSSPPASSTPAPGPPAPGQRGRGRPSLGVIAREVTLLPRHWAWLAAQPGGASVALRKLVEEGRRTGMPQQQARAAQERAYRFMAAMAGDMPGFEEATRALFADDRTQFDRQVAGWPDDVRAYAGRLAFQDR
jgi:uncharacterized protein